MGRVREGKGEGNKRGGNPPVEVGREREKGNRRATVPQIQWFVSDIVRSINLLTYLLTYKGKLGWGIQALLFTTLSTDYKFPEHVSCV